MHYEKAPLLQRVAVVMGAASAPLHCRSATAALGSNGNGEWGAKGLQKDIGKSAREWHFGLDHPIAFGADRHRNHSLPKTRNGTAGATLDSSVGFLPTPGFPKRLGFGRQWGVGVIEMFQHLLAGHSPPQPTSTPTLRIE